MTKVIFRKFKAEKSVIAIFPEELGNSNPATCMSYMHLGQHGACNPSGLINGATVPAKPAEYRELAVELRRIGYNLQVIHHNRHAFFQARRRFLCGDW